MWSIHIIANRVIVIRQTDVVDLCNSTVRGEIYYARKLCVILKFIRHCIIIHILYTYIVINYSSGFIRKYHMPRDEGFIIFHIFFFRSEERDNVEDSTIIFAFRRIIIEKQK